MSTSIGTLRERKASRAMWPAAFLAAVIMITAALVTFTLSQDGPRTVPPAGARTEVSGDVAPGSVSATAANTPSEIRGGLTGRPAKAAIVAPFVGGNTPSEVTGGMGARYDLHQRV